MAVTAPLYQIGDIVYLVASAKRGFLEAYRVELIHAQASNKWVYQIDLKARRPNEKTIGDAVDLKRRRSVFFAEAELTDFCSANQLTIDYLQRKLAAAQALQDSRCTQTGT